MGYAVTLPLVPRQPKLRFLGIGIDCRAQPCAQNDAVRMKLKQITLRKFKRFDDLTIDLRPTPAKIIALVGPNGCGKSSVFDAFEQVLQNHVGADSNMPEWFYNKTLFGDPDKVEAYAKNSAITLESEVQGHKFGPKSFYVRSAYRFTPTLQITEIRKKEDALLDRARPGNSSSLDQRLQHNYERLLGRLVSEFYEGSKTGGEVRKELIDTVNARLKRVLDIQVANLGNVTDGKGQLYFTKGDSKNFPFENLSAGEKEVVDMLIDLEVKRPIFNDTVYCIDEPELHLNTAIQRRLLTELADLVPDGSQLWVATHSVGFLRALQHDLAGQSQILDFSERDYFTGTQAIKPIKPSRASWRRIFSTALEDLTGLIAPRTIIYCEGRTQPTPAGAEQGLDALVYNRIFEDDFPDVLFVSSGGGQEPQKYSGVALKILEKAFDDVNLVLLKDRDRTTDLDRQSFLNESPAHRMLERSEIENYLLDPEILQNFCSATSTVFDKPQYETLVHDARKDDLKLGQTIQKVAQMCGHRGDMVSFKTSLAAHVTAKTRVYAELKDCIWPK